MNPVSKNNHRAQNVPESLPVQKQQHWNINEMELFRIASELRNYQSESPQSLAVHFQSEPQTGLTTDLANSRLREDGPNIVLRQKERSKCVKFMLSFCTGFSPILWALVILMLAFWEPMGTKPSPYNALVIVAVLVLIIAVNSLVPFILDVNTDKILLQFDVFRRIPCFVVRDGQTKQMEASKLVVGDIVLLNAGHRVPADLRIIETDADALEVDSSLLTGRYQPVRVSAAPVAEHISYYEASNIVFLGSIVSQGTGRGIVIATGKRTQLAKLSQHCGTTNATTNALEIDMRRLLMVTTTLALPVIAFVVIYWLVYSITHHLTLRLMVSYLFSIVLATVPIGLPVSIRLGMVLVSRHLTRLDVLPKSPGNLPTLGAVTVALMDKTGTLTQNKFEVSGVFSAQDVLTDAHQLGQVSLQTSDIDYKQEILKSSHIIAALCNGANSAVAQSKSIDAQSADEFSSASSKSVDRGLFSWASEHINVDEMTADREIKMVIPFTHENMVSVAVVSSRSKPEEAVIMAKGAPEQVLAMCGYCLFDGRAQWLTTELRVDLQRMIDAEAEKGGRVVALAQRGPVNETDTLKSVSQSTPSDLTFVSAVALADPPREGARVMVKELRGAGIMVAMLTGDSVASATAVARREGVYADSTSSIHTLNTLHGSLSPKPDASESVVITGEEVDQMSEVEWNYVLRHNEIVFARASSYHKLRIVQEFQKRGQVVSVTGDGVNDSAALHGADVGIATNGGSDVAREVAEVVLLRDDILAIPKAVKEGRLLFDNLQKAVMFALIGDCWSVLLPLLLAFCLGLPNPMPIFHMVVMSCLSNVFGTVALMCEGAEPGIMSRPPGKVRNLHMLTWRIGLCAFVYGNMIAFGASFNYSLVMMDHHATFESLHNSWRSWTDVRGSEADVEPMNARRVAASVYFVTVVVGQLFSLLAIRRRTPYFYQPPRAEERNPVERTPDHTWYCRPHCLGIQWVVVVAWFCSLGVTFVFLYVPFFNVYCRTMPVEARYWGLAVGWGALWFIFAEVGKWVMI